MPAVVMDGKELSKSIKEELKAEVEELKAKGVTPRGEFIVVGDDEWSNKYVRMKVKRANNLGMIGNGHFLPAETSQDELLDMVKKFGSDPEVHGILVQLPLPKHINEDIITEGINPLKDIDGFSPKSFGDLLLNKWCLSSPAGQAVIEFIDRYNIDVKGKHAVLVGITNIVGLPLVPMLWYKGATVTMVREDSPNLLDVIKNADILNVDIAKDRFIKKEMLKPGVAIFDHGNNWSTKDNRMYGDVDTESVQDIASYITPVPGG
ncbi:MAG: bifunctional 5,10-methylenetetrahydrofolate dehydrogenase/5,10-methenyltetrahydrofolate cyclohydrolase, partial [Candidatus Ranarchaeia archaeon]